MKYLITFRLITIDNVDITMATSVISRCDLLFIYVLACYRDLIDIRDENLLYNYINKCVILNLLHEVNTYINI